MRHFCQFSNRQKLLFFSSWLWQMKLFLRDRCGHRRKKSQVWFWAEQQQVIYELQKLGFLVPASQALVIFVSINDTFRFATVSLPDPFFPSLDDPWEETADSTFQDTHFSSTEEKFSFKPLDNRCRPKDYRSPGAWAKTFDFAYFIRCKVFENLWKKSLFNFFWNFEKKKISKIVWFSIF